LYSLNRHCKSHRQRKASRAAKIRKESFELLSKNELIQAETARRMRNMIGFRNIAIHDYQALNLDIVVNIVLHRLDDFKDFVSEVDNYSD